MFPSQETTSAESKNVANFLCTMASGDTSTSTVSYPSMSHFLGPVGSSNGGNPILTSGNMTSLEQTYIELQSVSHGGAVTNGGYDPHTQSGFVPPVVDPSSREHSQDSFESDPDWEPGVKRARSDSNGALVMSDDAAMSSAPQRKYTRRKNEKLTPEEEQKQNVRRERNKRAAAKCRQKRVDHTNALVVETEQLEAEKHELENEIHSLHKEKEKLETVLRTHQPVCLMDTQAGVFKIKAEPRDSIMTTMACSTSSSHLALTSSSSTASTRPNSLALDRQQQQRHGEAGTCGGTSGMTLCTPSSELYNYTSLDSLVDGPTGLTPITSSPRVSCASQLHRNGSESGSEAVSSPTLISL